MKSNLLIIFAKGFMLALVCLPILSAEKSWTIDKRIREIETELKALPAREPGDTSNSLGLYVSRFNSNRKLSGYVTVDLGRLYPIDRIVFVPLQIQNVQREMESVGFPIRFDILGSKTENFRDPIHFYEGHQVDYPDPNGYPVFFNGKRQLARFIKIEVSKMSLVRGAVAFSLSEMFVFSNGKNVALKKKVSSSSSVSWENMFSDKFLVDGLTSLGQPILSNGPESQWWGWHAKVQKQAECNEFVELHFNKPHTINEIRLYPVYHPGWPRSSDYGFPIHFQLQIKQHESEWGMIEDWSTIPFPRPTNAPVHFPIEPVEVTAVRLKALVLPQSIPLRYIFAIAEMEVYEGEENIAPKGTIVSSSLHNPLRTDWNEKGLTDGFATRGKIIAPLAWLEGLAKRGQLTSELEELKQKRAHFQVYWIRILVTSVSVLSASLLVATIFLMINYSKRRKQGKELRNSIASDLHDDIGSNLASITILASTTMEQCEPKPQVVKNLESILNIAKESSSAMRDIVWMLHPDRKANLSLNAKLQDLSSGLLAGISFEFRAPKDVPANRLSLDQLHHFILFFKEALHNLMRHSQADQVQIYLFEKEGNLHLEISSNHCSNTSVGLTSGLKLRAQKMKAELSYQNSDGKNQLQLTLK